MLSPVTSSALYCPGCKRHLALAERVLATLQGGGQSWRGGGGWSCLGQDDASILFQDSAKDLDKREEGVGKM